MSECILDLAVYVSKRFLWLLAKKIFYILCTQRYDVAWRQHFFDPSVISMVTAHAQEHHCGACVHPKLTA